MTFVRYQKLLTAQLETAENAKAETERAKMESERAKQANERVMQQLENATQEYETAKRRIEKTMRELREVEARKADAHGSLMTMEHGAKILADKSAQLEMEKDRLENEVEILRERVSNFGGKELEKQQTLAQVTAKILDASAKLSATQEALADAEREVADAHHRAERKKLELAELERATAENNRQVSEMREKSSKLRANFEQLQRKIDESAEEHEAAVKKLGSVLESVAHANLQLAAKNEELRRSASAVSSSQRELDAVRADLERVKSELGKTVKAEFLNLELVDMEKEIEHRREEFQRFMRGCADKESAISSKMAELDQVVCALPFPSSLSHFPPLFPSLLPLSPLGSEEREGVGDGGGERREDV